MANLNFTNSVDFTTHLTLTPEFNFFLSLGGGNNGQFSDLMGTVGRGGRIWRSHHHYCACMAVVSEREQGFWSGARGGGEKVSTMLVSIGTVGVP